MGILVLFLILDGMLSAFHHWLQYSCRFVICDLYYVEVCTLYAHFMECIYHKWVLHFVKKLFYIYWDDYIENIYLVFSLLIWCITLICECWKILTYLGLKSLSLTFSGCFICILSFSIISVSALTLFCILCYYFTPFYFLISIQIFIYLYLYIYLYFSLLLESSFTLQVFFF